ncbi:MAG: restriction endonuclease subunit S, partial [Comamonadaceae bacterium]
TLGEVAAIEAGKSFAAEARPAEGDEWGIIKVSAMTYGEFRAEENKAVVDPSRIDERFKIHPGDILLSRANTAKYVGASVTVHGSPGNLLLSDKSLRLTPSPPVDSRWFAHYLGSPDIRAQISDRATGTKDSMRNIPQKDLQKLPVPLPPLLEQHRIVEALEDHLSRLDAAELTLSQAKERAANLSGKAINFSYGITTSADGGAMPPTPADVLDGDLPSLPTAWSWRRLGELGEVVGGITKDAKKQSDQSYPLHSYLRVANVQSGHLNLDHITEIRATPKQVEKLTLRDGDVLLNEGGDRDKLGRGWVWENQIPNCLHQNHVFRVRVDPEEINPRLIAWHANSFGRSWFMRNGKQSVNLASVSLKTIKAFPVPVPPPEEQESIVESITTALDSQSRLQSAIDVALARSTALRRSLLRAAFNGELVDQDPTNEPADVALAKNRDQQAGTVPRRRRKAAK